MKLFEKGKELKISQPISLRFKKNHCFIRHILNNSNTADYQHSRFLVLKFLLN